MNENNYISKILYHVLPAATGLLAGAGVLETGVADEIAKACTSDGMMLEMLVESAVVAGSTIAGAAAGIVVSDMYAPQYRTSRE